jgi:hypothetical protein
MSLTLRQRGLYAWPPRLCGKRSSHIHVFPALLLLLLVTAWLYAPALDFGFIWDDPLWYGRVVGKSLLDLIGPMPTYQFYRPGTMLYNHLFLRPGGTFYPPIMHVAQIGWHILNTALIFALCRRLGLERWAALAVAALAAWYPFSHQAVAWAAPPQVPATALQNGAWLVYIAACQRKEGRGPAILASLLLFLAGLTIHEATIAMAAVPFLLQWALHRQGSGKTGWWLALAYPAIAAGFALVWFLMPRQTGFTKILFEPQVMAYLLQGFIYPLLGQWAGYALHSSPQLWMAALGALVVSALLILARRAGNGRLALIGVIWALMGISPTVAGLGYSYVKLSPRTLYHSAPGVAILWASAILPRSRKTLARRLWRIGGIIALGLVVLRNVLLLTDFQHMYTVGTDHLAELIQAAQEHGNGTRLLFVNFPDRYAPKRPPYPLGYWGVTLAPGSVDLAAFPAIMTGVSPETLSRRMPWIDAEPRDAGPYQVDMRGELAPPDQLYQLAHEVDAVYLSRYHADGTLELQWAGAIAATGTADCEGVTFGETLCLQEAQVEQQPDRLSIVLTWLNLSPAQPHDTIFVHVGQPGLPPIAQSDGDFWLGMLPLPTLAPGDTIQEQRIIPLPEEMPSGQHEIQVGVYNRLTRERLPARTPQGDPVADDATVIGHLP